MNDWLSCTTPIPWTCFQVSYDYYYYFFEWWTTLSHRKGTVCFLKLLCLVFEFEKTKILNLYFQNPIIIKKKKKHKIWFDICKTQYIKADPFSLLQNKDPHPIQTSKSSILILLLNFTWHSNTKNLQLKAGFSDEQNLNPR